MEFKREIGDSSQFVESIVAFANRKGGTIILGVDDNCNIVGANPKDLDKDRVINIIRERCEPVIEPAIRICEAENKKLVIVNIPEGKDKPYLVRGRGVYIRAGSSDRIATRAELDQLQHRSQTRP